MTTDAAEVPDALTHDKRGARYVPSGKHVGLGNDTRGETPERNWDPVEMKAARRRETPAAIAAA